MPSPRLNPGPRLRERMRYAKMAGPVPRVLVLESRYWVDQACIAAAQRMGWAVRAAPVRMVGAMPREQLAGLLEALTDFRPDFVLAVNMSGMDEAGVLAELLAGFDLPYAAWFVDNPRTILMGRTQYAFPAAIALTWEAAYGPYLRACGFPVVETLPLACDDAVFDAPPPETCEGPPSFVGNSMIEFAEREWPWIAERPPLAEAVRRALEAGRMAREPFARGIEHVLEAEAGAFDAEALRHAELYGFVEGTRRLRRALAEALAPEGLVVHGDPRWAEVTARCAPYVAYGALLAEHYRRSCINLNSTSVQMAAAVNQRVFDAPAAGGFLLTDAQASLGDLFAADEVAAYASLDECRALLRHYAAHPAERRAMTARARARILGEHTYRHRLERIAAIVRGHFGG